MHQLLLSRHILIQFAVGSDGDDLREGEDVNDVVPLRADVFSAIVTKVLIGVVPANTCKTPSLQVQFLHPHTKRHAQRVIPADISEHRPAPLP